MDLIHNNNATENREHPWEDEDYPRLVQSSNQDTPKTNTYKYAADEIDLSITPETNLVGLLYTSFYLLLTCSI
jgi:hypothetical protein